MPSPAKHLVTIDWPAQLIYPALPPPTSWLLSVLWLRGEGGETEPVRHTVPPSLPPSPHLPPDFWLRSWGVLDHIYTTAGELHSPPTAPAS